MDTHTYPYWTLFKSYIADLGPPNAHGWATGSCPFCREPGTFRVNLKSGRWVCLPSPEEIGPAQEGWADRKEQRRHVANH